MIARRIIIISAIALALCIIAILSIANHREPKDEFLIEKAGLPLPQLSDKRKATWRKYRLRFLPDAYPGRLIDGTVVPHPIYGPYVINTYIGSYRATKDEKYLNAALKVGKAAINRMEPYRNALVFWYDPATKVSRYPHKFYSALTQARYLDALGKLYRISKEEHLRISAQKIFNSLLIKQEDGGALNAFSMGVSLEEYPDEVPQYTLNGWLTTLDYLRIYADRFNSEEARKLFDENVQTLEKIIHLFDMKQIANSRYQLTGYVWLKIKKTSDMDIRIKKGSVNIPNERSYHIEHDLDSRWSNSFLEGDRTHDGAYAFKGNEIKLNVLLSMISYPLDNTIEMEIDSSSPGNLEFYISTGRYDPLRTYLKHEKWTKLTEIEIQDQQETIKVNVPWEKAFMVAYPTHFGLSAKGKKYNSYHFIHIDRLKKLHDHTGKKVFIDYSNKWLDYAKEWESNVLYKNPDLALSRY